MEKRDKVRKGTLFGSGNTPSPSVFWIKFSGIKCFKKTAVDEGQISRK